MQRPGTKPNGKHLKNRIAQAARSREIARNLTGAGATETAQKGCTKDTGQSIAITATTLDPSSPEP